MFLKIKLKIKQDHPAELLIALVCTYARCIEFALIAQTIIYSDLRKC